MPRRKTNAAPPAPDDKITDYRYDQKRKHIPPAGLAAQGRVRETPKRSYGVVTWCGLPSAVVTRHLTFGSRFPFDLHEE